MRNESTLFPSWEIQFKKPRIMKLITILLVIGTINSFINPLYAINFKHNSLLQQVVITGSVTDAESGEPIVGANIIVKGTTTGTISDMDGKYSLEVESTDVTLVFSSVGYETQEIVAAGQTTIDVKLTAGVDIGEVVVVGYGTQTRRSVSGSVISANSEDIQGRTYSNVAQTLAGKLPGVSITQSQGAAGSSPVIKIRGSSSITAGTSPLYVVDGLPMENFNLNMINPQDIESVDVLKDASSAAIYGSRGANGVIIVTTKTGSSGKAKVSVTYEHGIQKVMKTVDMMDAQQYIDFYVAAKTNGGDEASIPPAFLSNPQQFGKGTDWQDVAFRVAPMDNIMVSVTGGNEKTQFLLSAAYLDQKDIVDNGDYKRLALRSNLKQKITEGITVGGNLAFTSIYDNTNGTVGKVDVVSLALQSSPIYPVYNENGNLGPMDPNSVWNEYTQYYSNLWHPYAITREIDKLNKNFNTLGNLYLEVKFLKDFKFRSSFGGNLYNIRFNYFRHTNQGYGWSVNLPAEAYTSSSFMFNWLTENTLTYEKTLGDHTIKALVGYTAQKQRDEFSSVTAGEFGNDLVPTLNAGIVNAGTSSASEWSMLSYLARINYGFMDKYFLTATIRRDGSSRFGSNTKWGYFPSVSAAWIISEEDFLQGSQVSNLKLKASYGLTGNNQIPNYGSISLMGSSSNYVYGSTLANGLDVATIANPDLKWEKTAQFNVGIELGVFDNRFNLGVEFYNSITKDLLLYQPIPEITGFSTMLTNIGKLKNYGMEFNFTSNNLRGEFKWTTELNLSFNRNEILALGPDEAPLQFNQWDVYVQDEIGQPISNFYGYIFDGVYNNQTEIDNSAHPDGVVPGDPIVRDVNGDGIISDLDRTVLGNAQPDFIAGMTNTFSYKGFEFSFQLQGSFGGEIVNQQFRYEGVFNGGRNLFASVANYWRSESNPGDGVHFRPTTNLGYRKNFSSLWVEDATYVRVRNIRLSYSLPSSLVSRMYLSAVRVYVNVENAFLFSDYSGYDPENCAYNATTYSTPGSMTVDKGGSIGVKDSYNGILSNEALPTGALLGVDFGGHPIPRVITFGINLEF